MRTLIHILILFSQRLITIDAYPYNGYVYEFTRSELNKWYYAHLQYSGFEEYLYWIMKRDISRIRLLIIF